MDVRSTGGVGGGKARPGRRRTLQGQLTWLVLGALLPFLPLLGGMIVADYQASRADAAKRVQEVARGTALAVERELRATVASLEALSLSPSLANGDMDALRAEAETLVQHDFPGAIVALAGLDGQHVFNTYEPPGSAVPPRPDLESIRRVQQTRQPAVSDMFTGAVKRSPLMLVDVPVFGPEGQVRAVLWLAPPLQTFIDIIRQQRPQPGWVVSVLDRQGVVVARIPDGERYVGRLATETFRRVLAQSDEGIADVVALDGTPLLAGWSRPGPAGWSVAIGITHDQFYPMLWKRLTATLVVSALTVLAALLLARIVAGRIARPVQALARYALQGPTRGPTAGPRPQLRLREADDVLAALCAATAERHAAEEQLRAMEAGSRAELERRIEERTAELQQAQAQLLQAQRMEAVGQLTAGVAHDFNNLLQAQIMGLELLLGCVAGNPRATRYAEMAIASGEQGAKLTHALLSFSRQQMLRPVPVALPALLERLCGLLSRTLGPQVALRTDVTQATGAPLADPAHLEAALLNLCLNARDAMEQRGGELRIEAVDGTLLMEPPSGTDPARYLVLAVVDEGEGMDEATMARAFEPFFTTKGIGRGSGLGLAMVQGFARQSGGDVRLHSQPGQGTRVELWLPRADSAPLAAGVVGSPARVVAGSGRVLLVDDDAAVRELLGEVLSAAGYDVVHARTGEDGLARLGEGQAFAAMVTDYAMPGITGGELVRQARQLCPYLPALVITGYAEGTQLDQVPGDVAVVRKPFRADTLATQVARLVEAAAAPP